MAGFLIPLAYGLLTAGSVAATVASNRQQKKAGELRQRIADAQAASERRRIVREERVRRAQVINAAAQTGTQDTSSREGALGSISSQTSANLSQSLATQSLSGQASRRLQRAQDFSSVGQISGQFAGITRQYL